MITLTAEDKICFAGDWHGNPHEALESIFEASVKGAKALVHVGDFGIWDNDRFFQVQTETWLAKAGITLYFVDGNHENFEKLYKYPLVEDGTRKIRDHIYHIPRGFRWEWAGVSFLGVGGAASIDKEHRREGRSWWHQELITESDVETAVQGGRVDILVSHDSPTTAPNSIVDDVFGQMQARRYWGNEVMEICASNRRMLQKITDVTTPHLVFHGHYHQYMNSRFTHPDGTEAVVFGLNQGDTVIEESTAIYSMAELSQMCNDLKTSTVTGL